MTSEEKPVTWEDIRDLYNDDGYLRFQERLTMMCRRAHANEQTKLHHELCTHLFESTALIMRFLSLAEDMIEEEIDEYL